MRSNGIRWAHTTIVGVCIAGASCGLPAPERDGSVPASPPRARSLTVGDAAPDFALTGSDGKEYRLASYRGKQAVVLAWFAKAFTEGCTAQCSSLRESGNEIRAYDVAYFAISVDPVDVNRKFAQSLGVDYPLLSDPTKATATAYGVVDPDQPFASRWTFFIGTDGRIAFVDKRVTPATHGQAVAGRLAELGVPRRR